MQEVSLTYFEKTTNALRTTRMVVHPGKTNIKTSSTGTKVLIYNVLNNKERVIYPQLISDYPWWVEIRSSALNFAYLYKKKKNSEIHR